MIDIKEVQLDSLQKSPQYGDHVEVLRLKCKGPLSILTCVLSPLPQSTSLLKMTTLQRQRQMQQSKKAYQCVLNEFALTLPVCQSGSLHLTACVCVCVCVCIVVFSNRPSLVPRCSLQTEEQTPPSSRSLLLRCHLRVSRPLQDRQPHRTSGPGMSSYLWEITKHSVNTVTFHIIEITNELEQGSSLFHIPTNVLKH